MSDIPPAENTSSKEELTEALAEATDSTPGEIEDGPEAFDVAPPWDSDIVDE